MQELDECLRLAREIRERKEYIIEYKSRAMSPKNQIITDMPKGGGVQTNAIESYLIRLEKLEQAVDRLTGQLNHNWNNAKNVLKAKGITQKDTIELLRYRFYCGYSWEKCTAKMKKNHPNGKWSSNKCFRVYRSVIYK